MIVSLTRRRDMSSLLNHILRLTKSEKLSLAACRSVDSADLVQMLGICGQSSGDVPGRKTLRRGTSDPDNVHAIARRDICMPWKYA